MLRWRRHGSYETAEAPVPGGLPEDRLFLWLGQDRLSAEIIGNAPDAAARLHRSLVEALGSPGQGPTLSARGEDILEPEGEVALLASWDFPAHDRERVRAAVQQALLGGGGGAVESPCGAQDHLLW